MTCKIKILIIEDEMPVALLILALLTGEGCDAEIATTAKRGMQLAEMGNFDLITLDVDLPDASGFNICSRLKEHSRFRKMPVIFVSARSSLEDQQHGLDVGAVDYITKPLETLEFAPRVLSHLKTKNNFHSVAASEGAMI